jgi:hypothetical protein
MKSVTVVDNPVRGGELGRRRDVVEYSLPGYVATTDDQFFEIVAMAGHAGAVLVQRGCHRCDRGYWTRLDAVRCRMSHQSYQCLDRFRCMVASLVDSVSVLLG